MNHNEALQKEVQAAIMWKPRNNISEIGVTAKNGVVTLTGTVNSFQKKKDAEDAVRSVKGVKALVEKIEVQAPEEFTRNDHWIADDIIATFKWNQEIPEDEVMAKVERGWVTLSGQVKWGFQKDEAAKALLKLEGIRGITNNIRLGSTPQESIDAAALEGALLSNWSIKELQIKASVAGNTVKLSGRVNTFYQKDEAERIVWKTPGVVHVQNELIIEIDQQLEPGRAALRP